MNNGQQHGQRSRMRGRNTMNNNRRGNGNNSGGNPLTKSYESNGPEVKIRGNAQTIAEKYMSLARDAQVSGDYVMAENYHQHAEHYVRLISAAQGHYVNRTEEQFDDSDEQDSPENNGGQNIATQDQPVIGDAYQNPRYRQNHNQNRNDGERNNRERFNRGDRPQYVRNQTVEPQPDVQPSIDGSEAFVPRPRYTQNDQANTPRQRNEYHRPQTIPRNPMEGVVENQPIAAPLAPKPIIERNNFVQEVEPELPAFLTATRRVAPRKPRPERPNSEVISADVTEE